MALNQVLMRRANQAAQAISIIARAFTNTSAKQKSPSRMVLNVQIAGAGAVALAAE